MGISYDIDEITVTAGAMGALYLSAVSILNPGDEAIILSPHWPNYTNMVKMCWAVPVYVNCMGEENRKKLAENIAGAITDKTRAVILNSPCNPTGMILERQTLSEIASLSKKHDLWVLSDEIYRTIVFDGECASILEMPDMKQRTILIDSFSKRFSVTGFRVGFVCAPKKIAQAVANLQENMNSCACMFAQYACKAVLENGEEAEKEICSVFKSRLPLFPETLSASEAKGISASPARCPKRN